MSEQWKYWEEPIDQHILDPTTTYKHHNVYTHLGCVLLRCAIGISLILSQTNLSSPTVDKKIIHLLLVFCVIVVLWFGSKYIRLIKSSTVVWKAYLRNVIAYTVAGGLIYKKRFDLAGTIMIADALMGTQSRHMAHAMSYLNTKNKY